jgi:hypothetical protein
LFELILDASGIVFAGAAAAIGALRFTTIADSAALFTHLAELRVEAGCVP